MAENSSIHQFYKILNTKSVRESRSILEVIWSELEPMIKEKITVIQAKVRERRNEKEQSKGISHKIPNQYPTMKNRGSVVNMVSKLADLSIEDADDDTDDDMIMSSAFMAGTYSVSHHPESDAPWDNFNPSQDTE